MNIIKPKNDDRIYKYYTLENNIKCILIEDKTLEKSYVVSSLNVGSMGNQNYYPGMAHLLEHMCFITSKKYKIKNYLAQKVAEYGGTTNAFTAELNTVYYLDIFNENLEEILDIFVDFLVNAELKEEYILTELNNVDAEHKKNYNNDKWKIINLERLLADKNNSYNGFFTGNRKTLEQKDIHTKMIDFYKKYYTSNNISICIASNKKISEQLDIVKKYYGKIPSSNIILENPNNLIKPFYNKNKGKIFRIKTIGDIKVLRYIFETPFEILDSKIFDIFASVLSSSDKNSCNDVLKSKGYINDLVSYYDNLGFVYINVDLTKEGEAHIDYVNSYIENSVNKILQFNWFDIFEYYKNKNNFIFNNLNKIDTLDLCQNLILSLTHYDPSEVYYGQYNLKNINKDDIKILKKYIDFNNCIRIYATKDFDYSDYNIDPYYKTKYIKHKFKNIKISDNKLKFDLTYYLIKPKFIKNIYNEIPQLIDNRIWYGGTSEFNEPVVYCNILFSSLKYFSSPRKYLITNICTNIINYYLNRELYKLNEFDFHSKISLLEENNSVVLNIIVYNDPSQIQNYIDKVIDLINNIEDINNNFILSTITSIKDNLKNIESLNPWEYTKYLINTYYDNFYNYKKLLEIIDKININEVNMGLKNFFKDTGNTICIYGNIEISKIPKFNKINLNNEIARSAKINFKNIIIKHPNPNENSNCVKICYFVGKFNPIINLHLLFIKLITNSIFFEELRTTKQLGYLVQMYASNIGDEYYIYQQIQSEFKPNDIIKNIEEFNDNLIKQIQKINLKQWKDTIINHLKNKDNNLNEKFNRYYLEIVNRTYFFDRNLILLSYIDDVTILSLINFIKNFILNNNNKTEIIIKQK
jgi:insulysin